MKLALFVSHVHFQAQQSFNPLRLGRKKCCKSKNPPLLSNTPQPQPMNLINLSAF